VETIEYDQSPREVIEHRLAVHPEARPIQQKVRYEAPERQDFIREQVRKMLEAGFNREVFILSGWPTQSSS
jgi:hypothetical protein